MKLVLHALSAARRLLASAQPSAADLHDAIRYINEMYEGEETGYGREIDVGDLRFKGIVMMDPKDFVEDSSYLGGKAGWLKKFPEDEWLEELADAYERDFTYQLEAYREGRVSPAIQIDGRFGDGQGRASLFHALGEKLPVAQYDLDLKNDAVSFEFKVKHGKLPEGEVIAKQHGKKVGLFRFYPDTGALSMLHGDSVLVNEAMRKAGVGTALLERFKGWLNSTYRGVLYLSIDATSRGSLRLFAKVFGKPLYLDDTIQSFDYEAGLAKLKHEQGRVRVSDEGFESIEADDYLRAIFWIGPGRVVNPWA